MNPRDRASSVRAVMNVGILIVFIADLIVPLGFAVAAPYVALLVLALYLPGRWTIFKMAGLLTALAIMGFFVPDPRGPMFWIAVHNRGMTLFVLWTVATLGHFIVRGQETIRRERDFNDTLIETASSIILLLDTQARIIHFNQYTAESTGYDLNEVRGFDWAETFVSERERPHAREIFQNCVQGAATPESRYSLLTRDGTERHFSWSCKPIREIDGTVVALLYIGHDITALMDAQRRAIQAERLAAIGQTVAVLSHESRNELHSIHLGLELLSCTVTDTTAQEVIGRIKDSQVRLQRLFEDVRQFAGTIHLEQSVVSLRDIWERAWSSLIAARQNRDAQLHENRPGIEVNCLVDAMRLEQVFRNLFENSLAACPDPVRIDLCCSTIEQSGQPFLRVSVRDNGPGFSPEAKKRAFEPFYTTKPQGTGLGIAICRRIVEAHGGDLSLSNGTTSGAEFIVLLPRGLIAQDTAM